MAFRSVIKSPYNHDLPSVATPPPPPLQKKNRPLGIYLILYSTDNVSVFFSSIASLWPAVRGQRMGETFACLLSRNDNCAISFSRYTICSRRIMYHCAHILIKSGFFPEAAFKFTAIVAFFVGRSRYWSVSRNVRKYRHIDVESNKMQLIRFVKMETNVSKENSWYNTRSLNFWFCHSSRSQQLCFWTTRIVLRLGTIEVTHWRLDC